MVSAGNEQDVGLNSRCLEQARTQPLSQDNLFHSMLGLLDVQTEAYQRGLDMFAACREVSAPYEVSSWSFRQSR